MTTKRSLLFKLILVIAIVIFANVLFNRLYYRIDFTGDQRFTLSNPTISMLKGIEDPITIQAYFSEGIDPQIDKIREDFKNLLVEYNRRSNGNVEYEFINPNEDESTEQNAQQQGIQPVQVQKRERDQMSSARAYLGAVVSYGNQKEVIPFMDNNGGMEYALTSSIKKVAIEDKVRLGYVQGHSEPPLQELNQVANVLSVSFQVDPVTLDTVTPVNFRGLVIVAPKDSFKQNELDKIDAFLNEGKNVFIAMNRVDADIQQSSGTAINTGLETWLQEKGIIVEENFVTDENCGSINVQQQRGFFMMNTPVKFPYLPIINNFSDHPVTNGIEQALMQFVSSISYQNVKDGLKVTPLFFSGNRSGTASVPTRFDVNKKWTRRDYPTSKLPLGVAIEGKISGGKESKMIVFGDGDFIVNGTGREARQLQPDAINLMANAVEWLTVGSGLGELRTKQITSRPIKKDLSDNERSMVKVLNFALPIFLIALYGFFRFILRRRKKMQWQSADYS